MNDLTRRVLDADARLTREDGTISSDQWDDAVMELLDAAPILARQVEDFHRWVQADRAEGHEDDALDKVLTRSDG